MTESAPTSASLGQELGDIEAAAVARAGSADGREALEALRVEILGKKGKLTLLLRSLARISAEERPQVGNIANKVKAAVEAAIEGRSRQLLDAERRARLERPQLDVTLPAFGQPHGHLHPLVQTMAEVCEALSALGFSIVEGPEVEDEYHNFEALNIPANHPARDMQDTFFVEGGRVLRTHTSPVQIRTMESQQPPLMIIAPGAVYRHDDDVTHSPMFHQVEGLMVDRHVTLRHLKGVLTSFLHRLFGEDVSVRFRPSYFPFTEPSAEVDIACGICGGSGKGDQGACRVCKGSGWLEILGSGMVHPAVFEHVGYDPEVYSGFAFGIGVERVAMLKHRIDDIRLFFANDLRFIQQF